MKKPPRIFRIGIRDRAYPVLLRESPNPPHDLWVRGSVEAFNAFSISIVGSRKPTPYGVRCANEVAHEIGRSHATIISGLAYGIDRLAHEAALETNTRTVAVLGGGISDEAVYPVAHLPLMHEIIDAGGAIISEHPPNTAALPAYFPQRNRIIAGLSLATLVIEGGERSGTLITAREAVEAGRDVFAVPGPIHSPLSAGTNALLDQGAFVARSGQEIIQEVLFPYAHHLKGSDSEDSFDIVAIISRQPSTLEMVIEASGMSRQKTLALLTRLELDGLITRLAGYYSTNT